MISTLSISDEEREAEAAPCKPDKMFNLSLFSDSALTASKSVASPDGKEEESEEAGAFASDDE
jgi:hypothetical protein